MTSKIAAWVSILTSPGAIGATIATLGGSLPSLSARAALSPAQVYGIASLICLLFAVPLYFAQLSALIRLSRTADESIVFFASIATAVVGAVLLASIEAIALPPLLESASSGDSLFYFIGASLVVWVAASAVVAFVVLQWTADRPAA